MRRSSRQLNFGDAATRGWTSNRPLCSQGWVAIVRRRDFKIDAIDGRGIAGVRAGARRYLNRVNRLHGFSDLLRRARHKSFPIRLLRRRRGPGSHPDITATVGRVLPDVFRHKPALPSCYYAIGENLFQLQSTVERLNVGLNRRDAPVRFSTARAGLQRRGVSNLARPPTPAMHTAPPITLRREHAAGRVCPPRRRPDVEGLPALC